MSNAIGPSIATKVCPSGFTYHRRGDASLIRGRWCHFVRNTKRMPPSFEGELRRRVHAGVAIGFEQMLNLFNQGVPFFGSERLLWTSSKSQDQPATL